MSLLSPAEDSRQSKNLSWFRRRHSSSHTAWVVVLQVAVVAALLVPLNAPELEQKVVSNFHPAMLEQREGEVYCSSKAPKAILAFNEDCIPCPNNAECTGSTLTCNPGYKVQLELAETGQHRHPPARKTCAEDLDAKATAAEVLQMLIGVLKERRGKYDCGVPLEPFFAPSDKQGEKPWSATIKEMCSGPGLTRWQLHFHPLIAPAIADEGVYFWLFFHYLASESAAELFINVERHYMFVPIPNPVDFPDLHKRLMKEQARSNGLTYTYRYDGLDSEKPFTCKISKRIKENMLGVLVALILLVIGSHLLHYLYLTYYIKREVLDLIRQHSHYDKVTLLTRGISTATIVELLRERLSGRDYLFRLLLEGNLTLERVDEVCHELLWSPAAGVHAYRLNETNHWWASDSNIFLLPKGKEGESSQAGVDCRTCAPLQSGWGSRNKDLPFEERQSTSRHGENITSIEPSHESDTPLLNYPKVHEFAQNEHHTLAAHTLGQAVVAISRCLNPRVIKR
ncbi:hypothetical protein Efla_002869 [Eimeria flavescens]